MDTNVFYAVSKSDGKTALAVVRGNESILNNDFNMHDLYKNEKACANIVNDLRKNAIDHRECLHVPLELPLFNVMLKNAEGSIEIGASKFSIMKTKKVQKLYTLIFLGTMPEQFDDRFFDLRLW